MKLSRVCFLSVFLFLFPVHAMEPVGGESKELLKSFSKLAINESSLNTGTAPEEIQKNLSRTPQKQPDSLKAHEGEKELRTSTAKEKTPSEKNVTLSPIKSVPAPKPFNLARIHWVPQEDQNYIQQRYLQQIQYYLLQTQNYAQQQYTHQTQSYSSQQYRQSPYSYPQQQYAQPPHLTQSQYPYQQQAQMSQSYSPQSSVFQAQLYLQQSQLLDQQLSLLQSQYQPPQQKLYYKNLYFHQNSTLYSGTEAQKIFVHDETYLRSPLNAAPIICALTDQDFLNHKPSFNHLICSIFCIASLNEDNALPIIFESPIFAREQQNISDNKYYYDFSIKKPYIRNKEGILIPKYSNNGKLMVDFVSSSPSDEQVGFITNRRLLPITRDSARKIVPKPELADTHGDQVALYTLRSNKQLFFKLITKHGHRSNYKISAFGCRYFSTYDACETCNNKIITDKNYFISRLSDIIDEEGYNKSYQEEQVPFYNLFYSYKPYNSDLGSKTIYNLLDQQIVLSTHMDDYKICSLKDVSNNKVYTTDMFGQVLIDGLQLESNKIYSNISKYN